jgi:hypothetical protein
MAPRAVAFLSYVREVDAAGGDVTRFRQALEFGVREHGWDDFTIFHDIRDVDWGDDWRDRARSSMADVGILIPIISPGLLRSDPCRFEIQLFLDRKQPSAGPGSAILPVYFVTTPAFEDAGSTSDRLIAALRQPTYLEFRQLRIRPVNDQEYRAAILAASGRVAALLAAQEKSAAATAPAPAGPSLDLSAPPPKSESADAAQPATDMEASTEPAVPKSALASVRRPGLRRQTIIAGLVAAGLVVLGGAIAQHWWGSIAGTKVAPSSFQGDCVVLRSARSYRTPDPQAPLGPIVGPGQILRLRERLLGATPEDSWYGAQESDGRRYYLRADVCRLRSQEG